MDSMTSFIDFPSSSIETDRVQPMSAIVEQLWVPPPLNTSRNL